MAIDRLSFPQYLHMPAGIEVPTGIGMNFNHFIAGSVEKYSRKFRTLEPGYYDLTPPGLTGARHDLVVTGDGRGIYRMLAQTPGVFRVNMNMGERNGVEIGGTQICLPEDDTVFLLAIPSPQEYSPGLRLLEIIVHVENFLKF